MRTDHAAHRSVHEIELCAGCPAVSVDGRWHNDDITSRRLRRASPGPYTFCPHCECQRQGHVGGRVMLQRPSRVVPALMAYERRLQAHNPEEHIVHILDRRDGWLEIFTTTRRLATLIEWFARCSEWLALKGA